MNALVRKLVAVLLAATAGCYSSTYHMAPLPDQAVELSSAELCRIYVLRPSQGRWNLRRVLVFDGEREIGSIHEGEYLCWERTPGKSQLTVVYDGPKSEGYAYTLFDIEAPAGTVSFYGVSLEQGRAQPLVTAMDPTLAREELALRRPAQPLETLGKRVE